MATDHQNGRALNGGRVLTTEGPGSLLTTDDTDGTDNGCGQHAFGMHAGRLAELTSSILSVLSVSSVVKTVFVSFLLTSVAHAGCGLVWGEPWHYFEGVDEQGYVMFTERLGAPEADAKPGAEGEAAERLSLPIYAIFHSNSGQNSPYAGVGWTVPLLESRMVQIHENAFRLEEPNGGLNYFYRDDDQPETLDGGSWKGEIRGETITVWASCGSKLVYRRGRIAGMELKGRKFDWIYDGPIVTEIREGTTPLLRVERDPSSGAVTGLLLTGNKRIELEQGERPRVEVINGMNLVGGIVRSLSKYTRPDGSEHIIEYGVDEKLNPTINRGGDRLVVWHAATRRILRDGEWSYDIKPDEDPQANAAIGRTNAKKEREFWHRNETKGEEIEGTPDGREKITSWFVSGKLNGKLRDIKMRSNGKTETIRKLTYDEQGRVLRDENKEADVGYEYEPGRKTATAVDNATKAPTWKKETDVATGRVNYSDGAGLNATLENLGPHEVLVTVQKNGKLIKARYHRINETITLLKEERTPSLQ